ncbi:MAG: hypothetical protein IKP14_11605 [Clostridiales bacterium]|nr:hypothetical protein [Clostridiales bacterium]
MPNEEFKTKELVPNELDLNALESVTGGTETTPYSCTHDWQLYDHGYYSSGLEVTKYRCTKCGKEAWLKSGNGEYYWQYS